MIRVEHLRKEYIIPSQKGRKGIKSFLGSSKEIVCGLQDVSFQIKEGEFVGLVGLNGAGKTTLIKVLSGILTPTKGSVEVLGYCPYKNRKKYTTNIGVVMGQRTVLFYDLPVIESYKFFADVYGVDKKKLQEKLDILDECMGLKQFLHIPVRKLSLGQRMRCEIGVSLLHNPKVLFLDEPTLGLDIVSKNAILQLLKQINKTQKTTMILTTHEIEDISKLCERVILIERGNIAYDGETVSLCERNSYKYIQLKYTRKPECKNISGFITEEEDDGCTLSWKVPVDKLSDVMKELLEQKECIVDINVNTASLTDVIFDMYTKEKDEEDDE